MHRGVLRWDEGGGIRGGVEGVDPGGCVVVIEAVILAGVYPGNP